MNAIRHVYVHVPFCSGRCLYCDFYSRACDSATVDRYLKALAYEVRTAAAAYDIRPGTIYMGGGTPSLLTAVQLRRLFQLLTNTLDATALAEWTIEANPGTLDDSKLALFREFGVNRVSIGAQSMDDSALHYNGRRHRAADTVRTVDALKNAGITNIGLDLIACLPCMNLDQWRHTMAKVIELDPRHVSVYALSVEPGSKLRLLEQSGVWSRPDTEEEQSALSLAEDMLRDGGYERYEISNYARPGSACLHNVAVWEGADYVGFGPSASSRLGRRRRTNDRDLPSYCHAAERGMPAPAAEEDVAGVTDMAERFMFSMRLTSGVDPVAFVRHHGPEAEQLLPHWTRQLSSLADDGLVRRIGSTWMLTVKGRDFADTVSAALLP